MKLLNALSQVIMQQAIFTINAKYSGSSVIRTPLYQASEKSVQISEFVWISEYARFYYHYC